MNEENQLRQIISIIKDGRANDVTAEEILINIDEIRPVKTIIETSTPKTSPERLQYLKDYYAMSKELELLRRTAGKKETYRKKKIERALKRTGFFCFTCKKPIRCEANENKHHIVKQKNQIHRKIIISNKCPVCQSIVRQFGGYLDD
ncbi:MAG: hypothetical protein U9Q27_02645 [Patescibacteria group bacterium]|nr:hypothetical protein [Patescibacteria group bacterium]